MNVAEDVKVTLRKKCECSVRCVSHADLSEKSQEDIQAMDVDFFW